MTLLRPVDLQVRGGPRAKGRWGRSFIHRHRFGQLPVAGGAKLLSNEQVYLSNDRDPSCSRLVDSAVDVARQLFAAPVSSWTT